MLCEYAKPDVIYTIGYLFVIPHKRDGHHYNQILINKGAEHKFDRYLFRWSEIFYWRIVGIILN